MHIGEIHVHETVLACKSCGHGPVHSDDLARLVAPGTNFGFDVTVYVGLAGLVRCQTADEIVVDLKSRNVYISNSHVRNLTTRFLAYLAIAHEQAGSAISEHLASNGGYILHIDSTSRVGSRKLMAGIDEVSGFVLLSVHLNQETAEDVAEFLRGVIGRFGLPLGIASDMARSIHCAITGMDELKDLPHYICHFHFLRDAGKDLFEEEYKSFSKLLDAHNLNSRLTDWYKTLSPLISDQSKLIEQLLNAFAQNDEAACQAAMSQIDLPTTVALLLESARSCLAQCGGYGFPFDRPMLTSYEHLLHIHKALDAIDQDNESTFTQLIKRITTTFQKLADDRKLAKSAKKLRTRVKLFDRLRNAFHVAPVHGTDGLNDPGAGAECDIKSIEPEVMLLSTELDINQPKHLKLREQIEPHHHGLFRSPLTVTTPDGSSRMIYPQRTNNINEQLFRELKHQTQRRTGTQPSAVRFDATPPEVLL
ncbi:MAG: hypothetical protein D6820_00495, partial [Lentisphaerae bacterium]